MPYPRSHMLLAFGGSLFGTEEWSCTLRSTPNFADGNDQMSQEACDAVAEVVRTWWTSDPPIHGAASGLAYVKFNRVRETGHYANDRSFRTDFAPEEFRNTAGGYPPQISLVATLETGITRGLAARGRIFLPNPIAAMGPDSRITAAAATGAATKVAALLTALNGVPQYGSTAIYSNVREGAERVVTGVTVGRVLDTMRSRRSSLPEERSPAAPVGGF